LPLGSDDTTFIDPEIQVVSLIRGHPMFNLRNRNLCVAWSILLLGGAMVVIGQRPGIAANPPAPAPDDAAMRALVRDEVGRQLPDLVAAEVKRQLDAALREAALRNRVPQSMNMLQLIRSQISLYMLQHNDGAPTLARLQDHWSGLTRATDADGKFGTTPKAYGPYLKGPPQNPFNGSDTVGLLGQATPTTGWVYDPSTGQLKVVIPAQFSNQIQDRDGEVPSQPTADAK
jgi:hypothetical protein